MGKLACWLVDRYAQLYVLFNPITPLDTMQVTDHVSAVKAGQVNFFIYRKDGHAVCIDTGFCRSVIARELTALGIAPNDIDSVFLTHTDFDHAGGVGVFSDSRVYLSRAEKAMIDSTRARRFGVVYNHLDRDDYALVDDNDVIMVGSIKVACVSTPGHTLGSMSYLVDDAYLFVGDAFRIIDDRVCPIHPILTMLPRDESASIRKLAAITGVKAVFTAHRGYRQDFYDIMEEYRNK